MSFIDEPILRALGRRGIKIPKQGYRLAVASFATAIGLILLLLSAFVFDPPMAGLGALLVAIGLAKGINYVRSNDDDDATY